MKRTGFEVYRPGSGEIAEKKSRFLSRLFSVKTAGEAEDALAAVKKEHYDARHNCWAYIIEESGQVISRCSDDGEPSQTAGRPILDVLQKERLCNAMLIVTRYFGGVLLGTGGLTRAYRAAAQAACADADLMERCLGRPLEILTDYSALAKIEHILRVYDIPVKEMQYEEEVRISCMVPKEKADCLERELIEASAGKARVLWDTQRVFCIFEGAVVLW